MAMRDAVPVTPPERTGAMLRSEMSAAGAVEMIRSALSTVKYKVSVFPPTRDYRQSGQNGPVIQLHGVVPSAS